jgi:hypothetical protein
MHFSNMKSALVSSSPYEPAHGLFLLATAEVTSPQPLLEQFNCFMQHVEQALVDIEAGCMKKAPHGGFSRFTYLLA